jgi:hypothetical protein
MKAHLDGLCAAVANNCSHHGVGILSKYESACEELLLWLQFLRDTQLTGVADELVMGTLSAIYEGASCLCLGLARPALNSLRLEIDLALAWLYFKDHSVEWQRVLRNGDGYKLKTEILKYLAECIDHYGTRFGILKDCALRKVEDPYRLLSAHIHGQSVLSIPVVDKPLDIVAKLSIQEEVVLLQYASSEYIGDIFWSVYSDKWATLPMKLRKSLLSRFKSPSQRDVFFNS